MYIMYIYVCVNHTNIFHVIFCVQIVTSLKHLSQGITQSEPKVANRATIESKLGSVNGWEELLTCNGFHFINSVKKDMPSTIVFPEHDDSGLQKKTHKAIESLLGTIYCAHACHIVTHIQCTCTCTSNYNFLTLYMCNQKIWRVQLWQLTTFGDSKLVKFLHNRSTIPNKNWFYKHLLSKFSSCNMKVDVYLTSNIPRQLETKCCYLMYTPLLSSLYLLNINNRNTCYKCTTCKKAIIVLFDSNHSCSSVFHFQVSLLLVSMLLVYCVNTQQQQDHC